ncbi:MAG: DUF1003 domain-containing protein [Shinella sp.]|nr:DUF1003 domain-containing protein [Shinella sp.]
MGKPIAELDPRQRHVLKHSRERKILTTDTNAVFNAGQSFGDRLADAIARVGGSWAFIIGFILFLLGWAVLNTLLLVNDAFDPYPFIFLNLVLSMIAALQAPIIMMSQNRQSERDRLEASKDYEVNLKAEIELMALHHKIDNLLLKEIADLKSEILRLHEKNDRAP